MQLERVEALVRAFTERTLPESEWTHAAHLIVGLRHVLRWGPERGLQEMRSKIRAYNERTGLGNGEDHGYHETVTRFYLERLDEFAREHAEADEASLFELVLRSRLADPALLSDFYSYDVVASRTARRSWCPPDRRPIRLVP